MKNLILAAAVLFTSAMSITSCTRAVEDVVQQMPANTMNKGQAVINANISGAHSTTFNAPNLTSTTNMLNGVVMMVGTRVSGATVQDFFSINIMSTTTLGNHTINENVNTSFMNTFTYVIGDGSGNKTYVAGKDSNTDFTYKITKNSNGEIEGTFQGKMYNMSNQSITVSGDFKGAY